MNKRASVKIGNIARLIAPYMSPAYKYYKRQFKKQYNNIPRNERAGELNKLFGVVYDEVEKQKSDLRRENPEYKT